MSKKEYLLFVDSDREPEIEVKVQYRELTTKPLPPAWRNFISKHFLDPSRKQKRYTFERDQIRTDVEFSDFFDKILANPDHIITECIQVTYYEHFQKNFIGGVSNNDSSKAVSNVREFLTFFSLFLAREWGINLSFFSIVFRKMAICLVDSLFPLLIGLYGMQSRSLELSIVFQKLEVSNIELHELGVPKHFCLDYSRAWKVLKKLSRCQGIIAQCDVLSFFYYNIFVCIDELNHRKRKIKDADLSKIILYCILKAQVTSQNVHCIIALIRDFSRGLISEKDYSVVELMHKIFSWVQTSVKVEREADFRRYHRRTVVDQTDNTKQRQQPQQPQKQELSSLELHRMKLRQKLKGGSGSENPPKNNGEQKKKDAVAAPSSGVVETVKNHQKQLLDQKVKSVSSRPKNLPSTKPDIRDSKRGGEEGLGKRKSSSSTVGDDDRRSSNGSVGNRASFKSTGGSGRLGESGSGRLGESGSGRLESEKPSPTPKVEEKSPPPPKTQQQQQQPTQQKTTEPPIVKSRPRPPPFVNSSKQETTTSPRPPIPKSQNLRPSPPAKRPPPIVPARRGSGRIPPKIPSRAPSRNLRPPPPPKKN